MNSGEMLIVPETEFEDDYLAHIVPQGETVQFKAYVKTGLEITNKLGVKLVKKENEKEISN